MKITRFDLLEISFANIFLGITGFMEQAGGILVTGLVTFSVQMALKWAERKFFKKP